MICPYCNKEIDDGLRFCPECGQEITDNSGEAISNLYWNAIDKEENERERQYRKKMEHNQKKEREKRQESMIRTVIAAAAILAIICGFLQIHNYQITMTGQIAERLAGKKFTAHASHMEGLGNIYHEYWQLTFKDNHSLEYAYIKTLGPREKDEQPVYKGTYSYRLSMSIFGNYTVHANGATYKLEVNKDNMPVDISR